MSFHNHFAPKVNGDLYIIVSTTWKPNRPLPRSAFPPVIYDVTFVKSLIFWPLSVLKKKAAEW